MTLKELVHRIEACASDQPSINMIVRNDIFKLNTIQDAKYGVFGWMQQVHTEDISTDSVAYSFVFYYVDRLNEDKSNEVEVQSVALTTLSNIIRKLAEYDVEADTWNYQTFNQRFHDECAGAFCNVTLSAPVTISCEEDYDLSGSYNESYDDDFDINRPLKTI